MADAEEKLKNMMATEAVRPGYGLSYDRSQGRPRTEEEIINELFTYHSPTAEQTAKYVSVRDAAKHMAMVILHNVPLGADRTAAIRQLRECVMTANAGIALNGLSI